jgi:ADP-ribose pyrophosphatase YjhB (NUDIX family)
LLPPVGILHGWSRCPRCAEALANHGDRVECAACGFVHWANSQPTACALVVDDRGRVLLGRRATQVFHGYWDTPGGFLQEGEDPEAALRRELREETGLDVEPVAFFGANTDRYGDGEDAPFTLNLYWVVRVVGGEERPDDDVSELRWFAPDELPPPEEIAFENVAQVLAAWRDEQP